jgi:hypothetical protein
MPRGEFLDHIRKNARRIFRNMRRHAECAQDAPQKDQVPLQLTEKPHPPAPLGLNLPSKSRQPVSRGG